MLGTATNWHTANTPIKIHFQWTKDDMEEPRKRNIIFKRVSVNLRRVENVFHSFSIDTKKIWNGKRCKIEWNEGETDARWWLTK